MEERKKRDFTSEPEQFRAVIAAFLLAGVQFRRQVVHFELPLADDLVERLLLLLRGVRDRRRAVHLDLQILHLGRQSLLRLLQRENLLVQRLDRLLRLGQPRLQLPLRLLQFLRPRDALRLVLGAPQLGLGVRLAQLPLEIGLALRLLLHLFPNVVQVVLQVAELAEQGRPLPRLLVRQSFRVLELGSQRYLDLRQLVHLRLGLLQLPQQIAVLDRQFLLRCIEVVQRAVHLLQFTLGLVQLVLQLFHDLLLGGLFFVFFEKEKIRVIQLLSRVNSLRIRFSNNYFIAIIIFGMFKRVFIFREKRVRKKGRRRRRRRNTRGGGEQQALQAEHTTFPTTIKSFAASLPRHRVRISAEKKLLVALVLLRLFSSMSQSYLFVAQLVYRCAHVV